MKTSIFRSERYLKYIREQPCCVCGKNSNVQPHHVSHYNRGVGIKASDFYTIPLCAVHHHESHAVGKESFSTKYNIDYKNERLKCLVGFVMSETREMDDVRDVLLKVLEVYVMYKGGDEK